MITLWRVTPLPGVLSRALQQRSVRMSSMATPTKRTPTKPLKQPAPHCEQPALQAKAARIAAQLHALYPEPPIPLDHGSPFQLLCAVMLSAQVRGWECGAGMHAAARGVDGHRRRWWLRGRNIQP